MSDAEVMAFGNELARLDIEVRALKTRFERMELRQDAGEALGRVHTSELTLIKQAIAESQDRLNMLLKHSQALVAYFKIEVAP